jgi:hypothetical protein
MVSFRTKNTTLGKIWKALDGKMLLYFMAFRNILWVFGIFYVFIWYIVSGFGTMYQEKSGNPDSYVLFLVGNLSKIRG